MNIALLSKDEWLSDSLSHSDYKLHVNWEIFESPEELSNSAIYEGFSLLVISDRLFSLNSLNEFLSKIRAQAPDIQLIVLLSNHHEAAEHRKYLELCGSMQAHYVLPGRGSASICEKVKQIIGVPDFVTTSNKPDGLGKIICFVGSTPNIGTTLISFGTALALAQDAIGRIGYLCLNLKSSKLHRYLGRDDRIYTLDALRAELKARSLTRERLLQVCESIPEAPSLHVLYGNMLREQAEFFTPEEIEQLLQAAREAFDVCIVDVNAYWDNAATVCGILQSDARVVVTTNDITQFQEDLTKWIGHVGSVFGLQPQSFELVASQMDKQNQSGSLTLRDIRKETQMQVIGKIHKHPEVVPLLNRGKLSELLQPGHPVRTDISSVAQKFIDKYGLTRKTASAKIPWFKRVLTGTTAN